MAGVVRSSLKPNSTIYADLSGDGVTDITAVLSAAISEAMALGYAEIVIPPGVHLISSSLPLITKPIAIRGAGAMQTILLIDTDLSGPVFSFSECWMANDYAYNADSITFPQETGLKIGGFSIVGDRSTANHQHGIIFYDRNDHVEVFDLRCHYLKGHGISIGRYTSQVSAAYMRESAFYSVQIRNCGDGDSYPAFDIINTGGGGKTNVVFFYNIKVIFPHGIGIKIEGSSDTTRAGPIAFFGLMLHGIQSPDLPIESNLMEIGDYVGSTTILGFEGNASYVDYYTIEFNGTSAANASYNTYIQGVIGSGNGGGINVEYGRNIELNFFAITTTQTKVRTSSNAGTLQDSSQTPIDDLSIGVNNAFMRGKFPLSEAVSGALTLLNAADHHALSNSSGASYAVTLTAPNSYHVGRRKSISMIAGDATNKVTLALTNVVGGSAATTATFDAAGETLVLEGIQAGASTYRWLVIKEHGVTLT